MLDKIYVPDKDFEKTKIRLKRNYQQNLKDSFTVVLEGVEKSNLVMLREKVNYLSN